MYRKGGFNDLLNFLLDNEDPLMLELVFRDACIRGQVAQWDVPSGEQVVSKGDKTKGQPTITVDHGDRSIVILWNRNTLEISGGESSDHYVPLQADRTLHTGAWVRENVEVTFTDQHPDYPLAVCFDAPMSCILYKKP